MFTINNHVVIALLTYIIQFISINPNVTTNIGVVPAIYSNPSKFINVLCSFTALYNWPVYVFKHCICPTVHLLLCDHDCLNDVGCSSYTIASVAQPNFLPWIICFNENSMSSVNVCVSHPFGFTTSNFTINPVPFSNGDNPILYLAKWYILCIVQ